MGKGNLRVLEGQKDMKGHRLMKNLMNVEAIQTPGAPTTVIQVKHCRFVSNGIESQSYFVEGRIDVTLQ